MTWPEAFINGHRMTVANPAPVTCVVLGREYEVVGAAAEIVSKMSEGARWMLAGGFARAYVMRMSDGSSLRFGFKTVDQANAALNIWSNNVSLAGRRGGSCIASVSHGGATALIDYGKVTSIIPVDHGALVDTLAALYATLPNSPATPLRGKRVVAALVASSTDHAPTNDLAPMQVNVHVPAPPLVERIAKHDPETGRLLGFTDRPVVDERSMADSALD